VDRRKKKQQLKLRYLRKGGISSAGSFGIFGAGMKITAVITLVMAAFF
jgi:hypothetical protein